MASTPTRVDAPFAEQRAGGLQDLLPRLGLSLSVTASSPTFLFGMTIVISTLDMI